jgi:hypothetical protein
MNLHQWKGQIRSFNKAAFTKDDPIREEWKKNTIENMHRFKKENSIWNLQWKYYQEKEKAMVLVGASPCLRKDVSKLKELDGHFCIVCANSSLKFLLKHGIKPKYCIALDSDSVDIPQHLDCDNKDITLFASTAMSSKALDLWKGPIYFMPYYSVPKELRGKIRRRLGKFIPGGGNSMTQAFWVVSVILGSKTVIFVANEYCFNDIKNYYADKKAAKQEVIKTLYPAVDVLGREKWTTPGHYNYAIWQERACSDLTPPGYFIDTSFGLLGKDCPAIHVMELSEAIKKVKEAFGTRDRLNAAKTEKHRLSIIKELIPKHEPSKVYHYNVQEHQERLLQLARS